MAINAKCGNCGAVLPVPEEYAGKSVRCGGCQCVVPVPAAASPIPQILSTPPAESRSIPRATTASPKPASPPRARPVAAPVARGKPAATTEPVDEKPIRKARKAKPEEPADVDDHDEDEPAEPVRTAAKRRPIAKRRRESVMTAMSFQWLMLMLGSGCLGLIVLGYAAIASQRKNDGTAMVPMAKAANAAPPAGRAFEPPAPDLKFEPAQGFQPVVPPPDFPGDNALVKPPFAESKNTLLLKYRNQVELTSSSEFGGGWTRDKVIDGIARSSWYSREEGGNARPWIEVTFPENVTVTRIVILGNRDQYGNAYSIKRGTFTLYDQNNNAMLTQTQDGQGARWDFELKPAKLMTGVRRIRFTAMASTNPTMCVAVSEFQVE